MKLKYSCGCSYELGRDGYGGVDTSMPKWCSIHKNIVQKYLRGKQK